MPLTKEEVVKIVETILSEYLGQYNIPNRLIKQRHLEAEVIFRGLAANRPDGSTEVKAYFATNTGVLSIWDGTQWVTTTLSP